MTMADPNQNTEATTAPTPKPVVFDGYYKRLIEDWYKNHPEKSTPPIYLDDNKNPVWVNRKTRRFIAMLNRRKTKHAAQAAKLLATPDDEVVLTVPGAQRSLEMRDRRRQARQQREFHLAAAKAKRKADREQRAADKAKSTVTMANGSDIQFKIDRDTI